MGNVQSRQRYYEVAYEATHNARELQHDVGGPRIRGAILAYIDDRISASRMMHECTQLEVCLRLFTRSLFLAMCSQFPQEREPDANLRGAT